MGSTAACPSPFLAGSSPHTSLLVSEQDLRRLFYENFCSISDEIGSRLGQVRTNERKNDFVINIWSRRRTMFFSYHMNSKNIVVLKELRELCLFVCLFVT